MISSLSQIEKLKTISHGDYLLLKRAISKDFLGKKFAVNFAILLILMLTNNEFVDPYISERYKLISYLSFFLAASFITKLLVLNLIIKPVIEGDDKYINQVISTNIQHAAVTTIEKSAQQLDTSETMT